MHFLLPHHHSPHTKDERCTYKSIKHYNLQTLSSVEVKFVSSYIFMSQVCSLVSELKACCKPEKGKIFIYMHARTFLWPN